jgi:hypothetical protein
MPLPRNLLQATAADIEALVTDRAPEGAHLDLKRELQHLDGGGRHELLADISAFANSSGGDVIYGVDEDGEGRAAAVVPQGGNADTEALRFQDVLMNGVEPRIPGLQVHSIAVDGGFVLVIRVPQSWAGPHRVRSNQHFFIREGVRKRQLDVPEIRGLFLRSEQQAQRVRDFRTERLGKIMAGEAPHRLVPGPLVVVHLVPTQAALGLVQVDPVAYVQDRTLPALGTRVPGARLNLDGALGVRNPGAAATYGYSQLFRNGFFETVKSISNPDRPGAASLGSIAYERDLINLLQGFQTELDHIGVGKEMSCMFSLTEANTVELGLDRINWGLDDNQGRFDRKTLVLPDVLLSADLEPAQALRPVFDLVWQSAGMERSANYNARGDWVPHTGQ